MILFSQTLNCTQHSAFHLGFGLLPPLQTAVCTAVPKQGNRGQEAHLSTRTVMASNAAAAGAPRPQADATDGGGVPLLAASAFAVASAHVRRRRNAPIRTTTQKPIQPHTTPHTRQPSPNQAPAAPRPLPPRGSSRPRPRSPASTSRPSRSPRSAASTCRASSSASMASVCWRTPTCSSSRGRGTA